MRRVNPRSRLRILNPLNLALCRHLLRLAGHWCLRQGVFLNCAFYQTSICKIARFWVDFVVILQQAAARQSVSEGDGMDDKSERETGKMFMPHFDDKGLLSAVVVDHETRRVLMVAFMDREALSATRSTGFAHFHSRSRGKLWKKGESSGHVLKVEEILVDCDQDALVLSCRPAGPTCHTGAPSCFYRLLDHDVLQPVKT